MISQMAVLEIALRILVAVNDGRTPPREDVEVLRRDFPASAHLPVDELACQAIRDIRASIRQ